MVNQWNESLWGDEGFSALAVMNNFWETMGIMMRDTSPPGFYALGWLWGQVFGYSEVALRSMSLVLMLGAAVFAGLTVYQLTKNKINALVVGLLSFGAPFLVPFAFEWRMYALLNFAVMGSVYCFVAKRWWGYVAMTLLMLYTHHFGLFTFAGQGVWQLIGWLLHPRGESLGKRSWGDFWPFLVVTALYIPWLYPFYLQLKRVQGSGFWLSVPTLMQLKEIMLKFASGGVRGEWQTGTLVLSGIILAGKRWRRVWRPGLGLALIYLMPVALAYLVSYLVTPIFYDRYLLSVVMGMMVLLGLGMRREMLVLVMLIGALYYYQSWQQFITPSKRPFRELAEVIRAEQKEGDELINWNGQAHHLWESKYYGLEAPIYSPEPLPLYVGTAQMTEEDVVEELPRPAGRLGVISSEPIEKVSPPGFRLVEYKQRGNLNISWWKRE